MVKGLAHGRTWVIAEADAIVDSVLISVVPVGVLATFPFSTNSGTAFPSAFTIVNLDGSPVKTLTTSGPVSRSRVPRFSPSGTRLVYDEESGPGRHIFSINFDGTGQQQLSPVSNVNQATQPQFSRDGNFIYYTAFIGELSVWRAGPAFENMTRISAPGAKEFNPTPSPDGSRIAYMSNNGFENFLHIKTLATGAVDTTTVRNATALRWSPVGNEIAYSLGGSLLRLYDVATRAVTDPDPARLYNVETPHIDWSPDGQWLVACSRDGGTTAFPFQLILIRRSPLLVIPLTWSRGQSLCQAAWKP